MIWHSTGLGWFQGPILLILINNALYDFLLSAPPKFHPGHLRLLVTGPDGPPIFKT